MKTLEEIIENADFKKLNTSLKERSVELAIKLLKVLLPLKSHIGEEFRLGGVWFEIRHVRSSAGSDDFLFMTDSEDEGALDVSKSFYFCNDFNCWIHAASSKMRLCFLNNAKSIFADLDGKVSALNEEIEKALKDTENI